MSQSITPAEAVKKMMQERGYVVIAFTAGMTYMPGCRCMWFAGGRLGMFESLVLTQPATRDDWDTQVESIFGDKRKNKGKKLSDATFWRAVLEEEDPK